MGSRELRLAGGAYVLSYPCTVKLQLYHVTFEHESEFAFNQCARSQSPETLGVIHPAEIY